MHKKLAGQVPGHRRTSSLQEALLGLRGAALKGITGPGSRPSPTEACTAAPPFSRACQPHLSMCISTASTLGSSGMFCGRSISKHDCGRPFWWDGAGCGRETGGQGHVAAAAALNPLKDPCCRGVCPCGRRLLCSLRRQPDYCGLLLLARPWPAVSGCVGPGRGALRPPAAAGRCALGRARAVRASRRREAWRGGRAAPGPAPASGTEAGPRLALGLPPPGPRRAAALSSRLEDAPQAAALPACSADGFVHRQPVLLESPAAGAAGLQAPLLEVLPGLWRLVQGKGAAWRGGRPAPWCREPRGRRRRHRRRGAAQRGGCRRRHLGSSPQGPRRCHRAAAGCLWHLCPTRRSCRADHT